MQLLVDEPRHSPRWRGTFLMLAAAAIWLAVHLLARWLATRLPGSTAAVAPGAWIGPLAALALALALLQQAVARQSLWLNQAAGLLVAKHRRLFGEREQKWPLAEMRSARATAVEKRGAALEACLATGSWQTLAEFRSRPIAENAAQQLTAILATQAREPPAPSPSETQGPTEK